MLIVLMAMANGFRVALSATGSPINAIVTQRGSNSELGSAITRDSAQFLSDDPRVMKDADGRALLSPELVVEGMAIGRSFTLQRRDWMIVGVFDAGGSGFESEIWGDVDVIGPAFNRGGYHSVTLRMRDPSTISALNFELEHNPRMQVQAIQERQYAP